MYRLVKTQWVSSLQTIASDLLLMKLTQLTPSPWNPSLQMHLKLPSLLMQTPLRGSQLLSPVPHSSISTK